MITFLSSTDRYNSMTARLNSTVDKCDSTTVRPNSSTDRHDSTTDRCNYGRARFNSTIASCNSDTFGHHSTKNRTKEKPTAAATHICNFAQCLPAIPKIAKECGCPTKKTLPKKLFLIWCFVGKFKAKQF